MTVSPFGHGRSAVTLAIVILCGACAEPAYWTRAGATQSDATAAVESCKSTAAKPAPKPAQAVSPPTSPTYATGFIVAVVDPPPNEDTYHHRVRDCMRRQGWTEASGPS